MVRDIYSFDPTAATGSQWTHKAALVPDPGSGSNGLGYIPAAAIGTNIYTGGGSMWIPGSPGTIADTVIAFKYDTLADSVDDAGVADVPSPGEAETRALNVGGQLWAIGGGRTSPNPSANVQIYDPGTNTWSVGSTFTTGRRNFPVDRDPATGKIYLVGGYDVSALPLNTMQIYSPAVSCGTPTPTNTSTPSGIVSGHLTWQGVASANRPLVTGTLTLCVSGSPQNFSFTTDTNGNFTVTTGLSDGVYHWMAKGGRHITSSSPTDGTDLVITGGHSSQEFGTQKGGDTNASNNVNATDFNALKSQFGGSVGQHSADFDYNLVVNASDFTILKGNFGQAGHAIICP